MRPVKIKDQNADFAKPRDWDESVDGPCGTLPIRREVVGVGSRARMTHYSNWRPDAAELAMLNAGGVVELGCYGIQPPVTVKVVEGVK